MDATLPQIEYVIAQAARPAGKPQIGPLVHLDAKDHDPPQGRVCAPSRRAAGHGAPAEASRDVTSSVGDAISDARLSGRADQQTIVERLLSITGEDSTTIGRKYLKAWTGTLLSRFVLISNELPKLADASGALASRFILLTLRNSFYGREDHALTSKLLTELPGVLNWALDGWATLKSHGFFRQPESARAELEQLEDLASPIGAFLRERCEIGPAYSADVTDVFRVWTGWCTAQGRDRPGTVQGFGRDLHAAVPGLKIVQPREDGARVRTYQGLRLKILY